MRWNSDTTAVTIVWGELSMSTLLRVLTLLLLLEREAAATSTLASSIMGTIMGGEAVSAFPEYSEDALLDQVSGLPGIEDADVPFNHFSGYLSIKNTKQMHYWFMESERDPARDPIAFWVSRKDVFLLVIKNLNRIRVLWTHILSLSLFLSFFLSFFLSSFSLSLLPLSSFLSTLSVNFNISNTI